MFDLRSVVLRWPRKWPSKDAVEAYGPLSFEAPPIKSGSHLRMRKRCLRKRETSDREERDSSSRTQRE